MEYRSLGASGLNVPVLGLGTASFRASANPREGIGEKAAARLVDIAIERGAGFFDTGGECGPPAEEMLGKALGKRRAHVLIATKAGLRSGAGPNQTGASRHHLIEACDGSLARLGTDYIDLMLIQGFDSQTPVEETLSTLDRLITAGKVRYIGCSDFAGWQLMKSLAAADRHGWARFVAHRLSWSLAVRDAEWDLAPLGADQNVASLVWGPLVGGLLSGKHGAAGPALAWARQAGFLRSTSEAQLFDILDCLGEVAKESAATRPQVALAWLIQRPTVASIFVGAGSPEQLAENLDAIDLRLTGDQLVRLDDASARPPFYPHGLQAGAEGMAKLRLPDNAGVDRDSSYPMLAL